MGPQISQWQSFYVIMGSSAAALTGLQFVVMTLVAGTPRRASSSTIGAFGTPTIVHFCAVLTLAAIVTAPWGTLSAMRIPIGVGAVAGLIYVAIVIRRARRQVGYAPVFEDWLWHGVLPLIAYALLLASAIEMRRETTFALFMTGAITLLLLFIGIHNAWDTVTYLATQLDPAQTASQPAPDAPAEEPHGL